ncbi:peptidoglycan-binding protein [Alteribacter aurantiacus]|uniref:C40 family peptidase n=1 Tax=Alteribacter aurantiacus TaxID=254410 RepID=UPI00047A5D2E|nr:peptidoglycan-binding protein [Alteribacter aurantiacus]
MSVLSSRKTMVTASMAVAGMIFAAPSATEASFGERTLHFGMNNSDVKVLQETLKEKGFFTYHTATGFYGEVTRQAVREFQLANGLKVDGVAGPQTFGALGNTSSSGQAIEKPRATAIPDNHLLRQGSSGDAVKLLQEKLKDLGYFTASANGSFQASTRDAVRKYQEANRLLVDGIAGPQTIRHLNSGNGKSYSPEQPPAKETSSSNNNIPQNTILRLNDTGANVSRLQEQLKAKGFYTYSITTTYGPITRQAVLDFQRAAGISADGIAGPQTFRALENWTGSSQNTGSSSGSTPSNGNTSSTSGTLIVGSEGAAVTELQNQLRTLGLFNVQPTGYFGSITKESVRKFQQQWNLTADGIATKATIQKLNEVAEIHRKSAQNSSPQPSRGSFNVMNLVADASNFLGTPYVWGGASPTGFDCSGFIQYVFKQNGVTVPRTAAQQYNFGKSVAKPQVGDIVFFETYTKGPSHNGIYIGNNQFIHSGSSTGITITSLSNSYWSQRYLGAKRLN